MADDDLSKFHGLLGGDPGKATLNFTMPDNEMAMCIAIGARIHEILTKVYKQPCDAMLQAMNVATVHCNGRPLRLFALLHTADHTAFIHDLGNIHHFLNTTTGKLPDSLVLNFEEPRK